jgi:predicted dehydrogenase
MPRKIRLGLIGCGAHVREAHFPRLERDRAVEIAAIADPEPRAVRRLCERAGRELRHFRDWKRMLREAPLDAVLIGTPHDQHHAQVRAALQAGLHVLVEKPFTIHPRHAKALLELARRRQRILCVAYQRHYLAAYLYARERIRSGELGRIAGVTGYVTQDWGRAGGWRLDPEQSGGGMFMDTGSHLVASALWLTGLVPRTVSAAFEHDGRPVDIRGALWLEFEGGASGTLHTVGSAGRHDERLAIAAERGSLVLHMHQWRLRSLLIDDQPAAIPRRIRDGSPDEAFLRDIRNGGRSHEEPLFALQVSRLTQAAYRSAALQRPVRVRA